MKKITALLSATVMFLLLITVPAVSAAAEDFTGLTIEELMEKFPQNKYWNHAPDQKGDPDSWTDTPCTHHDESDSYIYWRDHGCNDFTAHWFVSVQCDGFARKLAYDIYGSDCRYDWQMDSDTTSLKAGDVIRYYGDGHTIMVLGVEGDKVRVAECNYGAPCIIDWTRTESLQTINRTLTWVAHAPFEAPFTREVPAVIGDVNCDKEVNTADMVLLQKYLLGSVGFEEENYTAAELTGDDRVTVFDLIALRQLIVETGAEQA